ncbi:kinetochore-associated Ndc80 complex subunit spc24 [Thoreauomyces humboldtii]|nr:kinetochore-associated Ndc80 complex subunit spc24 [Thoreauomyces humboldtii]
MLSANPPALSPDFEDPINVAHQLLDNLDSRLDASLIRSIQDHMQRTQAVRTELVDDARVTLKALSRRLEADKEVLTNPRRQLDVAQHADRMTDLDRERFTVTREMKEADETIEALEDQLDGLEKEVEMLEREELEEALLPPTKESLSLQVFRGLGIEMQKDEAGNYVRCKVRRYQSQDIHIQEFADKFSRFFYANLLWDACL